MKIENKSSQNKIELNELQKKLNLKHFSVFVSPEHVVSKDQCIDSTLRLIKAVFIKEDESKMIRNIREDIEEEIKEVMEFDVF